jgi:cation diffusion facilitator CzcD-associated flavoprotein CzcO
MIGRPRVAIVGAGFGGLAMALELERAGIRTFEVFERAGRIGGVWRENTYPGAGCDVPSPFYSFSYEPNPRWPQRFAAQQPILEYMEQTVRKYGIEDRIRLDAPATAARYDEEAGVWELTVAGERREVDVLVCACGQLSEPAFPDVAGIDAFAGHSFHSALWDHDHDLTGRRVAVVGTGASAIQFVPRIAPVVERLHVFQRSAPYVMVKPERQYSQKHHELFERWPWLLGAERLGWYLFTEYGQHGVTSRPAWLRPWLATWRWNLRRTVKDPAKRAALTPDYEPGCKRVLFSDNYYEAIARDNVEIIPEGISALTPTGVVSTSGLVREVDTIIYATGFQAHGFVAPMQITGRGGRRLVEDAWRDGASAYLGISVPGFPNLFTLYGPNTNLGSGSIVYILESAARYIRQAIQVLAAHPRGALELRQERMNEYDQEIQRRLAGTVWATGCHSWYIDENGRNTNNWPGSMREYRRRTSRFDRDSYELLVGSAGGNGAGELAVDPLGV